MDKVSIKAEIEDPDTFDEDATETAIKDYLGRLGVEEIEVDWGPGSIEVSAAPTTLFESDEFLALSTFLDSLGLAELDIEGL